MVERCDVICGGDDGLLQGTCDVEMVSERDNFCSKCLSRAEILCLF